MPTLRDDHQSKFHRDLFPHSIFEGSLEVRLPTIWTDGKAEMGRAREEKRREEERRSEKRKRQKTEDAGAGKVEKSRFTVLFQPGDSFSWKKSGVSAFQ